MAAVRNPATLRALLDVLVKLPPEVRARAMAEVQFVAVGPRAPGAAGLCVPLGGKATHLVALADEASELAAVIAHELAHVASGATADSAADEAQAAALARSWGFAGNAADPSAAVATWSKWRERPGQRGALRITAERCSVECVRCKRACEVWPLTAPGRAAEAGAACDLCGWVSVLSLGVRCPCGETRTATWTDDATVESPIVAWACASCGGTASATLATEPKQREETDEVKQLRAAQKALVGAEEAALRAAPAANAGDEMARAEMRKTLSVAARFARKAREVLDPTDARLSVIAGAIEDVVAAGVASAERDYDEAAERLGAAARALDALTLA